MPSILPRIKSPTVFDRGLHRGLLATLTLCASVTMADAVASSPVPSAGKSGAEPQSKAGMDFTVLPDDEKQERSLRDNDYQLDFAHPHECKVRGGINNTMAKLHAGEPVAVAYLGGSITQAEGGWRSRTTDWLRRRYPKAVIKEINAGLSGTGADLGVARLEKDVLAYRPDLLFVEFVVNGGDGGHKDGYLKGVEGIIRKTLKANPTTDICFVYTVADWHLQGLLAEPPVLSSHVVTNEKLADHYQIPTINLGCQIAVLLKQERLAFKSAEPVPGKVVFSSDGVHPNNDGAQLNAGAVVRALLKLEAAAAPPEPKELPVPVDPENWEDAKLVDLKDVKMKIEGDWQWYEMDPDAEGYSADFPEQGRNLERIKLHFPRLLGTKTPGSSLTVRFRGSVLGFFDVGGPFAGQLKVSVDGGDPFNVSRFQKYSSGLRHQYFLLPRMEEGIHSVKLTLDENPPDKSAASDFADDPGKYQRNEVYLGAILLEGELLSLE
jgi:lysophospholipase L1-like esterase